MARPPLIHRLLRSRSRHTRRRDRLHSPAALLHFYFGFDGRISLSAYWRYWIIPLLVVLATGQACLALGIRFQLPSWLSLLLLWPSLSVSAKRLHDCNLSDRLLLLLLLPVAGSLVIVSLNALVPGRKPSGRAKRRSRPSSSSRTKR
jgi:hypothetical protein